jgi:hypothetical protein
MSAPSAANLQGSKPVRGRELLLPSELATGLPETLVLGDELDVSSPGDEGDGALVSCDGVEGDGDGVDGGGDGLAGEGDRLTGSLPANGSLYCSSPALCAKAVAGTSNDTAQKAASKRLVMARH